MAKVNNWLRILDDGFWEDGKPLTKKDREILRNRMSAQNSRRGKKTELADLQAASKHRENQFMFLLETLNKKLP